MSRLTALSGGLRDTAAMEWVLQVVDEIDDAIATVRHWWLGAVSAVSAPLPRAPTRYNRG